MSAHGLLHQNRAIIQHTGTVKTVEESRTESCLVKLSSFDCHYRQWRRNDCTWFIVSRLGRRALFSAWRMENAKTVEESRQKAVDRKKQLYR
jgi:hypothetical protein